MAMRLPTWVRVVIVISALMQLPFGVTLLLDVPRLNDGVAAFDQMVHTGKSLAEGLGGTLVDDNRTAVREAGLE